MISTCCGWPIENGFCSKCKEHDEGCDICKGTGKVEVMESECNDSTGFNRVESGTGKFEPCPECGSDTDMDDDS